MGHFLFLASGTTFLTQPRGLEHRMNANGPQLYILQILCAENTLKPTLKSKKLDFLTILSCRTPILGPASWIV